MSTIAPPPPTGRRTLQALEIGHLVSERRGNITGTQRFFFDLVRTLPAVDVRVRGLILGDLATVENPTPDVETFAPIGTSAFTRIGSLRKKVAAYLKTSDVVASHFAPHAFPVLDVVRTRPLVVHFHGPLVLEGRASGVGAKALLVRQIQETLVYGRAQRLCVLSRAFGDILEREYRVPPERIRIIPGGVDAQRFAVTGSRRAARERLGWPQDRPIVMTVRRLAPTKGVDQLLAAMPDVVRAVPDALLMIAGTGPLAADLQAQARAFNLASAVQFTGYVDEELLPLMYRAADLLIVPTVALEGFGLVVAEALACGTPALVTPVAGLPEVIRDLDPALILASSQPQDIAAGLRAALRGDIALPTEAACVDYAQRFHWPVIAERVRAVYEEVIR